MSHLKTQVMDYFDRNWWPYALGFNGLATFVSFLTEHGVLLISLVCTAIAPVILKFIAVIRDGKLNKEKLRHEEVMNRMLEEKLRVEIELLKNRKDQVDNPGKSLN